MKVTPLAQAKELQARITKALFEMHRLDSRSLTESEVSFRLEAISGMLIMAKNDVDALVRAWEHDPSAF